jgi:hypothetical protein
MHLAYAVLCFHIVHTQIRKGLHKISHQHFGEQNSSIHLAHKRRAVVKLGTGLSIF